MSTKPKRKKYITAKGTALYPHLRTPETYEGAEVGYTVQLQLPKEETDAMIVFLEKALEAAKKMEQFKGKKWSKEPSLGTKETKDGDTVFKFKTKASFEKDGQVIKKTVPVFDKYGKKLDPAINVGSGSIIQVSYSLNPYHKSATNNGISLYLEAVRVVELKEYEPGGNAESYGFESEAGAEDGEFGFEGDTSVGEGNENGFDF